MKVLAFSSTCRFVNLPFCQHFNLFSILRKELIWANKPVASLARSRGETRLVNPLGQGQIRSSSKQVWHAYQTLISSKESLLNLIFQQAQLAKAYLLCLNLVIPFYHYFLLVSLLKVAFSQKKMHFKIHGQKFILLTKFILFSPKTHIIDCYCNISANWNHFYFALI